jgi:hypothetical protein
LRQNLRDELRKVQSGVLMSEKARNPGVGYFSSFANGAPSPTSESGAASPPVKISTDSATDSEQAVNFEYIRNVILQFLEHKEMRVGFLAAREMVGTEFAS